MKRHPHLNTPLGTLLGTRLGARLGLATLGLLLASLASAAPPVPAVTPAPAAPPASAAPPAPGVSSAPAPGVSSAPAPGVSSAPAPAVAPTAAAPVLADSLYHVEVPLPADTPEARQTALGQALQQLLLRLTSDRAALRPERLAPLRADVAHLVQKADPHALVAADRNPLTLAVDFAPEAVEEAAHRAGFAVWHRAPTPLLLWLAVADKGERRLFGQEERGPLREEIAATGRDLGMEIALPRLDDEDRAHIEAADVWAGFAAQIVNASKRYGEQPIVSVALAASTVGRWNARAFLLQGGEMERIVAEEAEAPAALRAVLERAIQRLAITRPPVTSTALRRNFRITVIGATGPAVQAVETYLRDLGGVRDLERVQPPPADGAAFDLSLRAGPMALARLVTRGRVLAPVSTPGGEDGTRYRYLGGGEK